MALYKLCDFIIDIRNHYSYTETICRDYRVNNASADFVIEISEDELALALEKQPDYPKGYHENLCIYRKLCNLLAEKNCFLMHSSVVALEDQGYVFAAHSGTGKTTHSLLWKKRFPSAVIINGDKPLFKLENGAFYAYGTPWCGKEGFQKNTRVKVKAVCFIYQHSANVIERLSPRQCLSCIFDQVYLPPTAKGTERVLSLLDNFLTTIPFYRLGCTISDEAVTTAYNAMKG